MSFRKLVKRLHLWLGLLSGLGVFIIALTGCIYAFQEEIQDMTQPYRFVKNENKEFLLPSELKLIAEKELPQKHAHSVIYEKEGRSAQVIFYHTDPEYYYLVYLNPYTGEVLKVKDMNADFFRIVLMGHFYLWLPPEIGQPVTATVTLIFVLMLLSGLILWWPKNKNGVKQRFTIRWNAKWRRRNYDLHNIMGFYVLGIALILALTGLVWGFDWFAKTVYAAASGGKELVKYYEPVSDATQKYIGLDMSPEDRVWLWMKKEYPVAPEIEVHYIEDKTSVIAANANPEKGTYWKSDFRYFDQYTLKEIKVSHSYGRFQDARAADKLMRMNYDIHVGAIAGLPGKFLAFSASLIIASLPVTGFLIWLGRKKKQKAKMKAVEINAVPV